MLSVLWIVTLFDPQWLLAAYGVTALLKAPTILYLGLGAVLAVGIPTIPEWRRRWTWYLPFLCFVAICLIMVPFAPNSGLAMDGTRFFILSWTMVVGTVALVDTPRRAEILIVVYALQFIWWGLWGNLTGGVYWHNTLSNYDGFGSFMVIGAGLCVYMVQATDGWLRRAFIVAVPMCVIGVVSSFARGAFLGLVAVFGLVWLRSSRKGVMLAAGVMGAGLVIGTAFALQPEYWTEMMTITEGTQESTGEDRWELWTAAYQVYLQRPILGTGARNWGVFAADYFNAGEVGGRYTFNPGMLYNRSLHNSYVTVMAEQGTVGLLLFAWILRDFWRRNTVLRTDQAQQLWTELGGRLQLRQIGLGIEAALLGWLCAAFFYSQAGKHWLYTILALNLLFHSFVVNSKRASHATRPPRGAALRTN